MLERRALLRRRLARLIPQFAKERVEERRVVIAEMARCFGGRQRVEPDQMRPKAFGKSCCEIDASARSGIGIKHDQQVLVAHDSIS